MAALGDPTNQSGSPWDQQDTGGYQPTDAAMFAAMHKPGVGTNPSNRLQPADPTLPASTPQQWTDRQTGQTYYGGLAPDGRSLVTGFTGSNPQNTTWYDIQTGQQTQADPHPGRDVLKNLAMIWGGPETAGLLSGAFAGGAGAAGASGGGSAGSSIFPGYNLATSGLAAPSAAAAPSMAGIATASGVPTGLLGSGGVGAASLGAAPAAGLTGAAPIGAFSRGIGAAAPIATGILKGVAAGKEAQQNSAYLGNQQALSAAALAQAGAAGQVNQQIDQKQLQASDYQRNYRNALLASLLTGVQDVNLNPPADVAAHMGTVTGGLRPSAMPNRAQIGNTVLPQALNALGSNPSTTNLLPPSAGVTPNLQPLPSVGGGTAALSILAPILTGLANYGTLSQPAPTSAGAFGFNPYYVPGAFTPQPTNYGRG